MPRRSRPLLVDVLVVGAIVAVIVGLVVLQVAAKPGDDDQAAPSSEQAGGTVTQSTLGPSPTPSTTSAAPSASASSTSPASPTATPTRRSSAAVPQPGAAASSLAQSAQSLAARPSILRIGTFNVLGASHTRKGGDSYIKVPYETRMAKSVAALARHQLDVVGFQEFESSQARAFERQVGQGWEMYPSPGSDAADGRQTIAWRTETMELVKVTTVTYPYFHGQTIHTPAVELRVRATDDTFWVINVHNPATGCAVCGGNNDRWRKQAQADEVAAIRSLGSYGTPVFLVGDMNSKAAFYCEMSAAVPVVFAAGGSYSAGACHAPKPTPIDWILATRGVSFSGYLSDSSPRTGRFSDHPINSVTAILP